MIIASRCNQAFLGNSHRKTGPVGRAWERDRLIAEFKHKPALAESYVVTICTFPTYIYAIEEQLDVGAFVYRWIGGWPYERNSEAARRLNRRRRFSDPYEHCAHDRRSRVRRCRSR